MLKGTGVSFVLLCLMAEVSFSAQQVLRIGEYQSPSLITARLCVDFTFLDYYVCLFHFGHFSASMREKWSLIYSYESIYLSLKGLVHPKMIP